MLVQGTSNYVEICGLPSLTWCVSIAQVCANTGPLAGGAQLKSTEDLSGSFFPTNSRLDAIILEGRKRVWW